MKYLSVCSGIEAASVAWHSLGWEPLAFSEIEPFPRAVLSHHYPNVPLHGDFTLLRDQSWIVDADVLVGGTPCQAFSVAGLRQSLSDDRGNLSLEFVRLADAVDNLRLAQGREPSIIVWENVPGVLSVKDNAFGCFLAGLAGDVTPYVPPRGKWTNAGLVAGPQRTIAWRVLDAQYFGLAQRRKRVFVVASSRDGFDPAEVLFERDSVRRDTPPRRGAGKEITGTLEASIGTSRGAGTPISILNPEVAQCLTTGVGKRYDPETETLPVAFHPTQTPISSEDGTTHALGCGSSNGQASVAIAMGFYANEGSHGSGKNTEVSVTLKAAKNSNLAAVAMGAFFAGQGAKAGSIAYDEHVAPTLKASDSGTNRTPTAHVGMAVRRLTPRECERLQGFPDDYTLISVRGKPAADGPRYKALGNSMAVPVMAWIGRRINDFVGKVERERGK